MSGVLALLGTILIVAAAVALSVIIGAAAGSALAWLLDWDGESRG